MKIKNIITFVLSGAWFISCAQKYDTFEEMATAMADKTVPIIKVEEVKKLKESAAKIVFLDARELKEYNVSHIEGAKFVGYDNFKKDNLKNLDKNNTYIVYCSVGYRSGQIVKKMTNMGFKNVFNLYGGLFDWKNKGNKVVDKSGEVKVVHPYNKSWGKWLNKEYHSE